MSLLNRTWWLIAFSIAMGFLEASVVVYLRQLYYPQGFGFPLVVLSPEIGIVEIFREAATIIMLLAVGILTGYNARQRLAFFLISFAIWDLFYYVFLKLALDWPESLFTWDILFLIPAPWVGPVLSPLIICFTMLTFSAAILRNENTGQSHNLNWQHWSFIISGSLIIIIAWMWDYIAYSGRISDAPDRALEVLSTYVPVYFNWWMFGIGEALIIAGIVLYYRSSKKSA
ncbi:MAG TPA: hypothetical protein VGK46_06180 [Saprospiraceae bacterium]